MFTHCLSCRTPLCESVVLDRPVRGDRLAYDPGRGRLWSICRTCGSWNLAPIEARWEIVDALEGITTRSTGAGQRPRPLSRTDNITLFESGRLRIIRVGASTRLEEAWWRYGERLLARWREENRLSVGGAATVGAAIVGGILSATLPARYAFRDPAEVRRWLTFGNLAWRGRNTCARCGHVISDLSFFDRHIVTLRPHGDEDAMPAISRRCPRCRDGHEGGLKLTGLEAEQTLRRILAWQHHPAVPEQRIRAALDLIEHEGQPSRLVATLVRHTNQLGDLPPAASVALEIAVNEARERHLLKLELRALEEYWREAEALASIVDRELTPLPAIERLRLRTSRGR